MRESPVPMHKHSKHGERLLRIVEAFSRTAVSVLGDMVADEFIFGEISRVSREAPVLILKHRERSVVPGGAANAVYNLADLGVTVLPVGVVGDDEAGKLLLQSFRTKKISLSGILKLKGYTTVTKTRILAGHTHTARQQVVRVDREPSTTIPAEVARRLAIDAREYAPASDALLVSDYGYGAATPEILTAVRAKRSFERLPITLDSRYRMLKYSGITAATPNEAEVEQALGVRLGDDIERVKLAGKNLLQRMKLDSLLITRGRHGMMAFARAHKPVEIPVYGSDEVTDVTGAGDTVIAAFTAALAAGADSESAARIANYAGGIVVMKRGTATVSQRELLDAIEHE
ncbi:MAG: bifunctional heptose 7-phosphate kinase/heptose 1-phosphate adenyltransferase [Burkholderiales bacterium]